MRVLLDTSYARRAPYSGTAVYLARVQEELARLPEVEVSIANNPRRRGPAGGGLGSARNLASDFWWTQRRLPAIARELVAEVIHHPLPAIARRVDTPQVVTVHDLSFERLPERFDGTFRRYAHHTHRAAALAAGAVICISETTAADARSLWGVPAERIVVAPLGPGQALAAAERPAEPAHFLYVGDAEPRKNLGVLLSAYRLYRERAARPLELVLAGAALGDGTGVRVERGPSPARLGELLAGAAALVQPSLYEGFGMTPLEAMGVGTPVLAARAPGTIEVCGDAAVYADPNDPAAFAEAMAELAEDQALRAELARRGAVRAAAFSWAECARRHVYAYSLAVGG